MNITLPESTVELIDRVTEGDNRSGFIDQAVRHYVAAIGTAQLRKQLREGALQRAKRDLRIAEEWFSVEEDSWPARRG